MTELAVLSRIKARCLRISTRIRTWKSNHTSRCRREEDEAPQIVFRTLVDKSIENEETYKYSENSRSPNRISESAGADGEMRKTRRKKRGRKKNANSNILSGIIVCVAVCFVGYEEQRRNFPIAIPNRREQWRIVKSCPGIKSCNCYHCQGILYKSEKKRSKFISSISSQKQISQSPHLPAFFQPSFRFCSNAVVCYIFQNIFESTLLFVAVLSSLLNNDFLFAHRDKFDVYLLDYFYIKSFIHCRYARGRWYKTGET